MTRPRTITFVAWILILPGVVCLGADLWPLLTADAAHQLARLEADGVTDLTFAWGIRALAIVGGFGLLRGRNWDRWLLVAWMAFHVGLSFFHSFCELAVHVAIFLPLICLLFRGPSASYFQAA